MGQNDEVVSAHPPIVKKLPEPKKIRKDGRKAKPNQIQDEAYKNSRMALMVYKRLHGYSINMLANEFNLSPQVINAELVRAKKTNLLKGLEEKILNDLVPKAMELYSKALTDGDLFVAKDVFQQAHKIADRESKQETAREGLGLQAWLATRKQLKPSEEPAIDVSAETTTEEITDGTVLQEPPVSGLDETTTKRLIENLFPKVTQELEFAKLVGAIGRPRPGIRDDFTVDSVETPEVENKENV